MFLGIQDFDFAQIQSNLSKSNRFLLNFASIFHKSNQICPQLINFTNNFSSCIPNPTALLKTYSVANKPRKCDLKTKIFLLFFRQINMERATACV